MTGVIGIEEFWAKQQVLRFAQDDMGKLGGWVMAGGAVDIRRCQHVKVNGAQCGSPALRGETFCFHHRESRPQRVEVYGPVGRPGATILVPVLEDASSIQMVVRQVAILVLEGKIDNKRAGLALYALQIASSNLKRMAEEKPRPAQVVVDTEKVAETPIGMTPWSNKEGGHELEDEAVMFQGGMAAKLKQEIFEVRRRYESHQKDARKLAQELKSVAAEPQKCQDLRWALNNIATKIELFAG